MILISKKIFFLTTAILAIFVIQSCSGYGARTSPVFAFNTTNYINNNNNNNDNKNGDIDSGIEVDSYPIGIAVNSATGKIYVANEFSNTVSIIDETTDKIQATIKVAVFHMV
jgi:YVTN family beta-propeller protein